MSAGFRECVRAVSRYRRWWTRRSVSRRAGFSRCKAVEICFCRICFLLLSCVTPSSPCPLASRSRGLCSVRVAFVLASGRSHSRPMPTRFLTAARIAAGACVPVSKS
eukprot:5605155-Pleurochrysis_carterae.AAC.1